MYLNSWHRFISFNHFNKEMDFKRTRRGDKTTTTMENRETNRNKTHSTKKSEEKKKSRGLDHFNEAKKNRCWGDVLKECYEEYDKELTRTITRIWRFKEAVGTMNLPSTYWTKKREPTEQHERNSWIENKQQDKKYIKIMWSIHGDHLVWLISIWIKFWIRILPTVIRCHTELVLWWYLYDTLRGISEANKKYPVLRCTWKECE